MEGPIPKQNKTVALNLLQRYISLHITALHNIITYNHVTSHFRYPAVAYFSVIVVVSETAYDSMSDTGASYTSTSGCTQVGDFSRTVNVIMTSCVTLLTLLQYLQRHRIWDNSVLKNFAYIVCFKMWLDSKWCLEKNENKPTYGRPTRVWNKKCLPSR